MGQIVLSVDQTGVNQVFKALFNAMPAPSVGKSFTLGAGGGQFSVMATVQAIPLDYAPADAPVDLRGSALNPQIRIKPLAFKLVTDVQLRFQAGGWTNSATAQMALDVTGEAHAALASSLSGNVWRTRLTVAAADVAVSLSPNKQKVKDAVAQALGHIDISPAPGPQPVPAALRDQLVSMVFDQLATPIEAALTNALKSQIGALKVDLIAQLPAQWPLQVPGGGTTLTVTIQQLSPQVTADLVRVLADFTVS